jgi:hypothetical protein
MHLPSTLWRAALKWPRLQRLEVLDVPEVEARIVQMPKVGSGTIRMQVIHQLREHHGGEFPRERLWEYVRFVPGARFRDLQPPRFSFAFVRDPYARLVSCYRHKIVRPREAGRRISPVFAVYGRRFSLDMGFPEFVAAVASIPDGRAEKHFRSQTHSLYLDGEPVVDFVGRLERFERDWGTVCERSLLAPAARAYNVTGDVDLGDWYDERLLRVATERYRADLDLLGYPVRGG